jgi:long-chain acyl-CoA synthetase
VFAGAMASTGGRLVVVRPESALPLSLRWIRRLGSPLSSRRHGLNSRSAVAWSSWLSATADAPEQRVGASAPAVVHLSLDSGEQLCTFSHGQLICGAEQLRSWLTDALPGEDTWLLLDPLNTTLGIVVGLGTSIMLRSRLVLLPQWDARDVLDALRYVRPSYVAASGPSMARLARASELRQADTRSVRAWIVGDPLTAEVRWSFEEATGLSLCQGFGPPCTAGLATCNPVNSERARGSVGLPLPGVDARLVGKDGDQLPLGRQGILQLRGPNIAAENEWLDTGLEGRMDQRGFLFLNGD